MPRLSISLVLLAAMVLAPEAARAEPKKKLLIAFSSYRERPKYPTVYVYEHDGASDGRIIGSIAVSGKRSDTRPSLSLDGKLCAFASEEENLTSRVLVWDVAAKKLVDLPAVNDSPNAQLHPALSGDGKLLTFAAWDRPGSTSRWDLFLYDIPNKKFLSLPGINTSTFDERMPTFSGDGRVIAYTTNAKGGAGSTDIELYDGSKAEKLSSGRLNSPERDVEPSLSYDGRLIALSSDRPGGAGGRDIYLFDRAEDKLVPLPGLNSAAQEQTPSLSADGRYLVFVSERIRGAGERDVFLYDRRAEKLLPTPGLNAANEDLDPWIVSLPETSAGKAD
jgi:Tol biopolymer transport system component